jgi:hypothetical protein
MDCWNDVKTPEQHSGKKQWVGVYAIERERGDNVELTDENGILTGDSRQPCGSRVPAASGDFAWAADGLLRMTRLPGKARIRPAKQRPSTCSGPERAPSHSTPNGCRRL